MLAEGWEAVWGEEAGVLSQAWTWNDESWIHQLDFFSPKAAVAGADEVLPGSSAACFTIAAAQGSLLCVSKLPCWHQFQGRRKQLLLCVVV